MEPSLPVKASLLVVMADYRIELVIKQVKKGIARDHLLAAWKPSLPVKASLLVVMAQISQVCVMGKIHLFACVS